MPRKRMIDPSFWSDEKLGECTRDERLLFMGLISNADDEGYGRANPKLLRSSIFPYDDLRVSDLQKWLSRLGGLQLIALYEVNGQTYYYLPNFSKHQTINRPTPSIFPKPGGAFCVDSVTFSEDSLSAHGALTERSRLKEIEKKRISCANPAQGDAVNTMQNSVLNDDVLFEKFWEAYPKRKGKNPARKSFRRLQATEELLGILLSAIEREKQSEQWTRDDGRYIPYPATWLNQRRWEDEPSDPSSAQTPDYLTRYL